MRAKLIWTILSLETRKILAYRSDFWINYIAQTVIAIIISYSLWHSIFLYKGVEQINGFTLNKLVFYYLIASVTARVIQGQNIGAFSREIYEGTLNKYLVYPLSFYGYKTITFLLNGAFYLTQFVLIYLFYYFILKQEIGFDSFLLGTFSCFFACLVYFALVSCIEFIAFWADNTWSLVVMLRVTMHFLGGVLIPLSFFPEWAQTLLSYTPFPYLVSFPIRSFMGEVSSSEYLANIFIQLLWFAFFRSLAHLIWKKGTLKYTGVGI